MEKSNNNKAPIAPPSGTKGPLTLLERVNVEGDALRGTIVESLHEEITGAMREEDTLLMKFNGMYQQDDRDRREERAHKKLERLYSFMIRLR